MRDYIRSAAIWVACHVPLPGKWAPRLLGFGLGIQAKLVGYRDYCPGQLCDGLPREKKQLERTPSLTRYAWDGRGKDPNADLFLCRHCAKDYTDLMRERHAEYDALVRS